MTFLNHQHNSLKFCRFSQPILIGCLGDGLPLRLAPFVSLDDARYPKNAPPTLRSERRIRVGLQDGVWRTPVR